MTPERLLCCQTVCTLARLHGVEPGSMAAHLLVAAEELCEGVEPKREGDIGLKLFGALFLGLAVGVAVGVGL